MMDRVDSSEVPLLPPVRLPSQASLAAAVRACPLASALAAPSSNGTSSADSQVVEVARRLADAAGLGTLDGGGDDAVMEVWGAVCRVLLLPQELGEQPVTLTLLQLFFAREPLSVRVLESRSPALLGRLGLVEQRADSYTLTPLGLWAGRELAQDLLGQDVPVLGTFTACEAGALLWALRAYPERERDEELDGWLSGRDTDEAARSLGAALATTSPLGRAVGVELLATRLGPSGVLVLESLLSTPRVGSLVAARLGRTDREPEPGEVSWVLVDMAAGLLEYGGEVEQVIESVSLGMDPSELAETIAILAFGDHPATEPVLQVFAEHHTDPHVSAAARKALRRFHGLTAQ